MTRSAVSHDDQADIAAILAAEAERQRALVAVDLAALDALFAEDLVHVHSNALTHDKAGLLAHIQQRRAFVAIERGGLQVRISGDLAVLQGPMTNFTRGPDGSDVILSGFVTQVLRREGRAWRFIAFQLTTDPSAPVLTKKL